MRFAVPGVGTEDIDWWCERLKRKGQIDWERVIDLSLSHDVFPAVYKNLKKMGWLNMPEDAVRKFGRIRQDMKEEKFCYALSILSLGDYLWSKKGIASLLVRIK